MSTIYLHPMIVHFPIALLIIGAIVALTSKFVRGNRLKETLFQYASISIIIGAAAAVAAVVSGYLFTEDMVGVMGEMRSTHIMFAFISVACGAITAILMGMTMCPKIKKAPILPNAALICSLITAVMIGITGHYGGMMVFA